MAKQSYTKDQHAVAKAQKLPLATIGFDGRYLDKQEGAVFSYGPVGPETYKKVKALLMESFKSRHR